MAYRTSRGKGRAGRSYRSGARRGYSRPRTTARRSGRAARGRGQTVRLVIQHAPAQQGYMPGIPGTVGLANVPPGNPKAKF